MDFELHPQLQQDTCLITDLPLCRALLANDSRYVWVILVPRRPHIREAFELTAEDQSQLMRESNFVSERLYRHFNADKMNVAALGNMVPQLHVHHVVRVVGDDAWPAPVWGRGEAGRYFADSQALRAAEIRALLAALTDGWLVSKVQ